MSVLPPRALPDGLHGPLLWQGCVRWQTVFQTPQVQIGHWHCVHDDEALHVERFHPTYSLTLVQNGACRIQDGDWSRLIDPTTAVLQQPGAPYKTTHPFGCGDSGWTMGFRRETAEEVITRAGGDDFWTRPSMTVPARPLSLILRQLILLQRRKLGRPVPDDQLERLSLEVLEQIVTQARKESRGAARDSTRVAHEKLAERTRDYLVTHYRRQLRLQDVAEAVSSSPAHLCRVFKRHSGLAIGEYLRHLRLSHVIDTLLNRAAPLRRLATDIGFCSHAHLTTTFHREVGFPPRRIRSHLGGLPFPEETG